MAEVNLRISEFIPFQMGLQIPCCVYPPKAAKNVVSTSSAVLGGDLPCVGSSEGVPDSGRTCDARSCAYVHCHSAQISCCFGDWLFEREECHCARALWSGAQFHRGASLGSGICGIHRWV